MDNHHICIPVILLNIAGSVSTICEGGRGAGAGGDPGGGGGVSCSPDQRNSVRRGAWQGEHSAQQRWHAAVTAGAAAHIKLDRDKVSIYLFIFISIADSFTCARKTVMVKNSLIVNISI